MEELKKELEGLLKEVAERDGDEDSFDYGVEKTLEYVIGRIEQLSK
jgi:hypothetical protein